MPTTHTEGPLGFDMTDQQAIATAAFLKVAAGPFQHAVIMGKALEAHARTDISWISTETADRYNHVIRADGMDDSAYALNPVVTLNHDYRSPPIGRSLWRHIARRAGTKGVQAMTHYPPRPDQFEGDWPPDRVFAMIRAGLLNAKSIGLIPLAITEPQNPDYPLVVDRWALIEYAVGTIPVNPETTIIAINKLSHRPTAPPPPDVSLPDLIARIPIPEIMQKVLDKLLGIV